MESMTMVGTMTSGYRMNLLFIFTDQQTVRAMSAAGNPDLSTPRLDALAASGVRFTNSFCASPLCSPSRGSLATGMLPSRSGVTTNHQSLRPDLPHLGGVLRNAGYETVWAGKWHVPNEYPVPPETIPGFDILPLAGRELDRNAYPVRVSGRPGAWDHNLGHYADAPYAEAAAAWLKQKRTKPFCLAVSLMNPHDICFPEAYPRAGDPPNDLPELPRNFAPPSGEPTLIADTRYTHEGMAKPAKDWTERDWRLARWRYHRFTEMADRTVGTVLDALRESGRERDTLVCFTSDHGEGAGSHRWIGKLSLYEESVAVPFILSCPGTVPGGRVDTDHLVSGVDVLPTLCEYAGVPIPPGLDGVSVKPVVDDPALPGRDAAVVAMHPVWQGSTDEGRLLRTKRWAYAAFSRGPIPESLFDLRNDPGETRNLAADPAFTGDRQALRSLLAAKLSAAGDSFRLT